MAVQTAYEVPSGSVFMAKDRKYTLMAIATIVANQGQKREKPSEYFMETTQTVSNKPARIR